MSNRVEIIEKLNEILNTTLLKNFDVVSCSKIEQDIKDIKQILNEVVLIKKSNINPKCHIDDGPLPNDRKIITKLEYNLVYNISGNELVDILDITELVDKLKSQLVYLLENGNFIE